MSRRASLRTIALSIAIAAGLGALIALAIVGTRGEWWSRIPDGLEAARAWRDSPLAPPVALAAYAVGALVVFPVNLLIAATVVVFGQIAGAIWALAGSLLSAAVVHAIGRLLPADTVTRLTRGHGERLRHLVMQHGIIAVAAVRIVPVAPYSVVGLAAGAARVPFGAYLAGTAIGMLPGILVYAIFVDRALEVLRDPRPMTWLMLLFAIALIVVMGVLVRRYRRRSQRRRAGGAT